MSRLKAKAPGEHVILVELRRRNHPPPPGVCAQRRPIQPVEQQHAGLRRPQAGQQRDERRLPASRWSGEMMRSPWEIRKLHSWSADCARSRN